MLYWDKKHKIMQIGLVFGFDIIAFCNCPFPSKKVNITNQKSIGRDKNIVKC